MDPVLTIALAFALTLAFVLISFIIPTLKGAPFVPSSADVVRQMLRLAKVQPGEEVYDLGSGDGRIVIISAKDFGARSTGVEIDPFRASYSKLLIRMLGLKRRARVICASFYNVDLSRADVVTLYLLQETNDRLKPKLEKELKPTSRVVSRVFRFDWELIDSDEDARIFVYRPHPVGLASARP